MGPARANAASPRQFVTTSFTAVCRPACCGFTASVCQWLRRKRYTGSRAPGICTDFLPEGARMPRQLPDYAELHALSNFSFQRGASHAEELVERAHALGYQALAITDECSVAGVVRAHEAAKRHGLKLLPGAEFLVQAATPFRLVVLPHNASGWGNLCEFITAARQALSLIHI